MLVLMDNCEVCGWRLGNKAIPFVKGMVLSEKVPNEDGSFRSVKHYYFSNTTTTAILLLAWIFFMDGFG